jgi:hypothetical protein
MTFGIDSIEKADCDGIVQCKALNVHPLKDERDGCGGADENRHQERWNLCRGGCWTLNDGRR